MGMIGLNATVDEKAKANAMRWYGHDLSESLESEVDGQRKRELPKRT